MVTLPPVLHQLHLPLAELCAARLDGELFALDEAFVPVDLCDTPEHRARTVYLHCADRLIAELRTAAWIWGAAPLPPVRHELCARITARARPITVQRSVLREVVIEEDELRMLGGVLVTSPLRTTVDIARSSDEFDAQDAEIVRSLFRLGKLELADVRRALDRRRNLPNKVRAMKRIVQALSGGLNRS
jgi:predicted anti-sigma-YlaC factor YlaD